MDEAYLCLKCRETGHVVRACPNPWPSISGTHKWAFSSERIQLLEKLQLHEQNELCTRCRDLNILSMFEGELEWKSPVYSLPISSLQASPHYRNLGTVDSVVFRRDCPLCICVFACAPNPRAWSDGVHILAEWSIHRLERMICIDSDARNHYDKCLLVDLLPSDGDFAIDEHMGDALGLLQEPSESLALTPRIVDSLQCDLEWVKECLSICQTRHGLPCVPYQGEELQRIQLIDVESRKLVAYPESGCEYICLSYVWGPVNAGRYVKDEIIPTLPKTIEDAITLCRKLQKRYLWVDSVCINQENDREKMQNIQRMSSIYKGAYASIVALCGSSMNAGLARIGQSSRPTQPQLSCSINNQLLIGLSPTLSQQIHNNTWGTRAWTLQEALLSPRCIYISDHQAYFECNTMQSSESLSITNSWIHQSSREPELTTTDSSGRRFGNGTLRNNVARGSGRPKDYMMIYGTLLSLYSFRNMKTESDALNAFSGILQHLKTLAHPNGFFWGLPVDELNWSLLWCSYGKLQRREGFPAWSWAGWTGVVYPGWPADMDDPHRSWTYFFAWKVEGGTLVQIYPTDDNSEKRTKVFEQETVFDKIADLPLSSGERVVEDLVEAEKDGFLVLDCAVCGLEFIVGDKHSWQDFGPFQHFKIQMNGMTCTLRTVKWTVDYSPGDVVELKGLALVGREKFGRWVYHHFLQIEVDGEGTARTSGVWALMVPLGANEVLGKVDVVRRKVVLV
ncbi:hypothetical protein EG329_007523 [Mollisiaceae sp. DMI_Dod_QoI]|nr:hypothetical protein EG329_007523 [Helotiales sp. DMI_Dod_QoI]